MSRLGRMRCWIVLLIIANPSLASASSQDLFGLGARGAAMGGAVVSNINGFASVYYNPAGLVVLDHNRFSVGYQRADYALELNGEARDQDSTNNLVIGVNIPLPLGGFMQDRLALGVGFLLPMGSVLLADLPQPEEPHFVLLEGRPDTVGLHIGVALRLFDWLAAGVSVVALAELQGGLDVAPNNTGNLGTVVRDELVADYAPIVGIQLRPTEWLYIGVTYHDLSEARFEFPITADLGPGFPLDIPLLNIKGIAQYDPTEVSADVTIIPIDGLELAAGVTFKQWSAFENPMENTTEPLPPQDPANFSDTLVPRVGAEYTDQIDEATLAYRMGGFLEPTPVPEQAGNSNYLDSARLGIGAGIGLLWRGITIDLTFQFQHEFERTHVKEEEAVRNPENGGLPEITHNADVFVSVFELGVAF